MRYPGLRILLLVHGMVTLAAGIVLVAAPGLIPRAVGIHLAQDAYLVAYLLAGAEFGVAVLSFAASRLIDRQALRPVVWSCIVFHSSSGILEIYAFLQGGSAVILGNVAARIAIVALFLFFWMAPVAKKHAKAG